MVKYDFKSAMIKEKSEDKMTALICPKCHAGFDTVERLKRADIAECVHCQHKFVVSPQTLASYQDRNAVKTVQPNPSDPHQLQPKTAIEDKSIEDKSETKAGKPLWYYVIAIGFLLWFVSNLFDKSDNDPVTRSEQVQALFMPYDGYNYELVQRVKQDMNDPDSFEHVETTYHDSGTGDVQVFMTFRGKNALGALVLNRAVASIDPNTSTITKLVIEH